MTNILHICFLFVNLVATASPQLAGGIAGIGIPSISSLNLGSPGSSNVGIGLPTINLGGGGSGSSSASASTFWDRFINFNGNPVVQLTGILSYDNELVWKVIFSVFFLYVGIILFVDGRMITNSILRTFNAGRGIHNYFFVAYVFI